MTAKRKITSTKNSKNPKKLTELIDFGPWNFIIFVTLGLILIIFVMQFMSQQILDVRARAGLDCPNIKKLPRLEDCPGGEWKFTRDQKGCRAFICNINNREENSLQPRPSNYIRGPFPVVR